MGHILELLRHVSNRKEIVFFFCFFFRQAWTHVHMVSGLDVEKSGPLLKKV